MNSMSRSLCEDKFDSSRKFNKECPTVLKCGAVGGATIPTTADTTTIATLSTNLCRFNNPIIKLEFASNVTVSATAKGTITLTFQVNKLCRGMLTKVPVDGAWTFTRTFPAPAGAGEGTVTSDTFSFFVCDCDFCSDDCCTYTVDVTNTAGLGAIITNARLSAIITCATDCCGC